MTPALVLGGPLAKACTWCEVPPHVGCRRTGRGAGDACPPHAARVKAAPPIVEAHVGDLVLVRYRGEHVAQLVDIGDPGRDAITVRFWRPSAQVFASPRLLEREAVIGLAPDDARTDLPRAWLADEKLKAERARAAHLYATDSTVRAAVDAALDFSPGPLAVSRVVTAVGEPIKIHTPNGIAIDLHDGESVEIDTYPLAADIAEGRGPFDPGQDTSDPSPTTPDAPPDPWFTSDSAETTALPKGW